VVQVAARCALRWPHLWVSVWDVSGFGCVRAAVAPRAPSLKFCAISKEYCVRGCWRRRGGGRCSTGKRKRQSRGRVAVGTGVHVEAEAAELRQANGRWFSVRCFSVCPREGLSRKREGVVFARIVGE
jgi:hypothetical protein